MTRRGPFPTQPWSGCRAWGARGLVGQPGMWFHWGSGTGRKELDRGEQVGQSVLKPSAHTQVWSLSIVKAQNVELHRALSEIIMLGALSAVPSLLQSCLYQWGQPDADTDSKEVLPGVP